MAVRSRCFAGFGTTLMLVAACGDLPPAPVPPPPPPAVVGFALTTTPAGAASVTQGSNTSVILHIARSGGNTSEVDLTATGTLPTGLTLSFLPTSTVTNSSALTVTATASAPVGTYPIVIHGTGAGQDEQVNLNLVVVAPPPSANVSVSLTNCYVVWVAYQDGDGPWIPVTGVNGRYGFHIAQSKGGLAFVQAAGRQFYVTMLYYSQAELTAAVLSPCGASSAPTVKDVHASVVNLPTGTQAWISFAASGWEGSGFASTASNGPVQLTNVLDGPHDLLASAIPLEGPAGSSRVFLARGLNPAAGGSLGSVDFAGASSFAPTGALVTLTGAVAGEAVSQTMYYATGPACEGSVLYSGPIDSASFTAFGIGTPNQTNTDFHRLFVTEGTGLTYRFVGEDFHTMGPRALTLPSALGTVTISDAGGPYQRLRLATTLPMDLNSASAWYCDQTVGGKCVFVSATAAWLGGPQVSFTLPDFSGLAGWNNTWAPATGDRATWYLSAAAAAPTSGCQEGARYASSSKSGAF